MASLSDWSPYDTHVQGGMSDGRFVNASYCLLASGPPRLANIGGSSFLAAALSSGSQAQDQIAYPMGVVQNFNISHNMQLARIFEIGSQRSYWIPGRTVGQMGLSRVMYHGPSLLRTLYAYYQDLIPPTLVQPVFSNLGAATVENPHDVRIPPGYENVFLNLASDLFTQPIGMLMMMKDSNEDTLGAVYLESCMIPNHSLGTDANSVVVQETASVQFERAVPVAVNSVGLISGIAA